MDEVVASFWLFVSYVLEAKAKASGEDAKYYEEQLGKARRLYANVPIRLELLSDSERSRPRFEGRACSGPVLGKSVGSGLALHERW